MKKITLLSCFALIVSSLWAGNPSVAGELGGNFQNYNTSYLTMGLSYLNDLGQGVELNLGMDFGITTVKDAGDLTKTAARFILPFSVGGNFLFPVNIWTFGLGVGLAPTAAFSSSSTYPAEFFMGPYLRGIIRVKVHPAMSLYTNIQQDLLIGGTNWINTTTRIGGGIIFNLGPIVPSRPAIPNLAD